MLGSPGSASAHARVGSRRPGICVYYIILCYIIVQYSIVCIYIYIYTQIYIHIYIYIQIYIYIYRDRQRQRERERDIKKRQRGLLQREAEEAAVPAEDREDVGLAPPSDRYDLLHYSPSLKKASVREVASSVRQAVPPVSCVDPPPIRRGPRTWRPRRRGSPPMSLVCYVIITSCCSFYVLLRCFLCFFVYVVVLVVVARNIEHGMLIFSASFQC